MTKYLALAASASALLLAACNGPYSLTPEEQKNAQLGAYDLAAKVNGKLLSCSSVDSEPDGYVSCDVEKPDKSIMKIACGYKSTGCKSK